MAHKPGKGFTGMRHSDEARASISERRRELNAAGWRPGNTGQKMNYSPEHMAKLRENLVKASDAKRLPDGSRLSAGHGYVQVKCKDHPSANSAGYVHEHRLVAERALGRRLKRDEIVHHINGNKADNRNNNLLICTRTYHHWLHNRMSELFQQIMFAEPSGV